jgi:S1-C subfamily serine protease
MRHSVAARTGAPRARVNPPAAISGGVCGACGAIVGLSVTALVAALVAALASASARAQTPQADPNAATDSVVDRGAMTYAHGAPRLPHGYLGITFVADVRRQYGPEGLTIYHYGYPAVAVVQPGSPAEQAGIVPGDTIVAYDSKDVLYRKIVLTQLLRPGSQLAVRIRRNGAIKNLSVNIAPRPSSFVDMNGSGLDATSAAMIRPYAATAPLPPLPAPPGGDPTLPRSELSIGVDAPPGVAPHDVGGTTDLVSAVIGGAHIIRTDADLQDALGVDGGVLVVAVGKGSVAAQAGIRAGDVITTAHGDAVDSPLSLARLVHRAEHDDQPVTLRVVRRHEARTVVLR